MTEWDFKTLWVWHFHLEFVSESGSCGKYTPSSNNSFNYPYLTYSSILLHSCLYKCIFKWGVWTIKAFFTVQVFYLVLKFKHIVRNISQGSFLVLYMETCWYFSLSSPVLLTTNLYLTSYIPADFPNLFLIPFPSPQNFLSRPYLTKPIPFPSPYQTYFSASSLPIT